MEIHLDLAAGTLRLVATPDECARLAGGAAEHGAFVAVLDRELKLYQELAVTVACDGREEEVGARVLQVFERRPGRYSTVLQVDDRSPLAALAGGDEADRGGAAASEAREAMAPEGESDGEPDGDGAGSAAPDRSETRGTSPIFRLRSMKVPERIRLATRAGRVERQILLRDASPQVLLALVANPQIEEREIVELIRLGNPSTAVLERIANDGRFASSYRVRHALVRHPRTPTPLAVRLLPGLRKSDLGRLAKASAVREGVRGAALRLYLKKL